MSLNVWLEKSGSGIFIRENGLKVEISREEWDRRYPGLDPVVFVQDNGEGGIKTAFSSNITHNLGRMADAAGIYHHLWRPDEIGIKIAGELVSPLDEGLARLKSDPERFKTFNAPNGWGLYEDFCDFVEQYLAACRAYPSAKVCVDK